MNEINYIRELAKKQAEIALLPVMKERLKKWYALNDGELDTPLVTVEFNGIWEEFFPPLQCETPILRELENQLIRNITNHELLNDDRVIPGYISVFPNNWIVPFGINVEQTYAYNSDNKQSMGYLLHYIIEDLERDYCKLKDTEMHVDSGLKEAGKKQVEYEEILGDILPVKILFPSFCAPLGNIALSFMGMQHMMIALYDYPELFHQFMSTLTKDYLRFMDEIEAKKAILCNNDGSPLLQGSWCYTNSLPKKSTDNRQITFADTWGYANFQETVGMSPKMFDEFFFSYMVKITDRFGLLSYGCCEPVDEFWESSISKLNNTRKLSISPWCNEDYIAEQIRGKKIVYHRKPSPNYISVDSVFDEEAFGKHIAKSVIAARGCPLEFAFREELTVRGEPRRLKRAVDITREQIGRYYR